MSFCVSCELLSVKRHGGSLHTLSQSALWSFNPNLYPSPFPMTFLSSSIIFQCHNFFFIPGYLFQNIAVFKLLWEQFMTVLEAYESVMDRAAG